MGCVDTISHDRWPRQGGILGQRVEVVFHYNTDQVFSGVCIRDDREEPFETIFALDNGRFVLASECQWRNVEGEEE